VPAVSAEAPVRACEEGLAPRARRRAWPGREAPRPVRARGAAEGLIGVRAPRRPAGARKPLTVHLPAWY
jgi:hypothetical protein